MPRHIPRSPAGLLVLVAGLAVAWYLTQSDEGDRSSAPTPTGNSVVVKVDRVVDGDTAKVFYGGRSEYVRYIGIDTPESVKPEAPVECFGEEAKRFNEQMLGRNSDVTLVFDREKRDRHGRLLAFVYSGSTLLQAELLKGGYAETLVIRPNDSKAEQFSRLEEEARGAGRGRWSAC